MTTEKFIEKARKIHGDKYDYSLVLYEKSIKKVNIICQEQNHGVFEQTPNSHLRGSGCPKCTGRNKSIEDFIIEAKKIHGDKYDYSLVDHVSSTRKLKIICPEQNHGIFNTSPQKHLKRKQGCPKCAGKNLTTEDFIRKAKEKHGDKFDYSLVKYINASTKIEIICPKHGNSKILPSAHLIRYGCKECGKEKIIESKTKWSYDKVKNIADIVNTRTEFKENYRGAYGYAKKKGFLDEINNYIDSKSTKKTRAIWIEKNIREKALECETKVEFRKKYPAARNRAVELGIYEEITSHMKQPLDFDSKLKNAKEHALNFDSRFQFSKNHPGDYNLLRKNNLLDEACSHMRKIGNRSIRAIYEIHFPRINSCYVGLTYDYKKRLSYHQKKSSNRFVKQLMFEKEEYKWIEHGVWYNINEIGKIEDKYIEERKKEGWNILNITKGGNVGINMVKFTKEEVLKKAYSCKSYNEFRIKYKPEHQFSMRDNFVKEIREFFLVKDKIIWSLEVIKEKAKQCKNLSEFYRKFSGGYNYAARHNLLNEIYLILPKTFL